MSFKTFHLRFVLNLYSSLKCSESLFFYDTDLLMGGRKERTEQQNLAGRDNYPKSVLCFVFFSSGRRHEGAF